MKKLLTIILITIITNMNSQNLYMFKTDNVKLCDSIDLSIKDIKKSTSLITVDVKEDIIIHHISTNDGNKYYEVISKEQDDQYILIKSKKVGDFLTNVNFLFDKINNYVFIIFKDRIERYHIKETIKY